jgi:hypothetical protein
MHVLLEIASVTSQIIHSSFVENDSVKAEKNSKTKESENEIWNNERVVVASSSLVGRDARGMKEENAWVAWRELLLSNAGQAADRARKMVEGAERVETMVDVLDIS